MKHIVSIEDLDKKNIMGILKRAKELVPIAKGKKKSKVLEGIGGRGLGRGGYTDGARKWVIS